MRAQQLLAPPHGFVWRVRAGRGLMRFSGSDGYADGQGWTRFWLAGALPIVRAGGSPDYAQSAAARGIAEAIFWCPAAMLPSADVSWLDTGSDNLARVAVSHRGRRYEVDVSVADDGRPLSVVLQRWSRENSAHEWRFQPFGGTIEQIRRYDGVAIATRVTGGNHFGTPDYFPFYRAQVSAARFL